LIVLLMTMPCDGARGQSPKQGAIRGVVRDRAFGERVVNATVKIAELGRTTKTGSDGSYVFQNVPSGNYTVVIAKPGFTRNVKSGVGVEPGQLAETDVRLTAEFAELSQFVARDLQLDRGSQQALLELRLDSPQIMDSISAELISQSGAGDAGEALSLVAGASTQENKAVIRGLPDRFVSTQLNGVVLPSADPETRSVNLDQFPSEVIESIQVSKTFTPDQQGNASGGAVNIVTRNIPQKTFLELGIGTNDNTQVRDAGEDFLTYDGDGLGAFGRGNDRGDLNNPSAVNNLQDTALGVSRGRAPLELSADLTAGLRQELDNETRIGGLLALFYDRSASYHEGGENNALWEGTDAQGRPDGSLIPVFEGSSVREPETTDGLLDVTQSEAQRQWGGLATLGLETKHHQLGATAFQTVTVEDQTTLAEDTRSKRFFFPGHEPSDPSSPGFGRDARRQAPFTRRETLKRTDRTVRSLQLRGNHTAPLNQLGEKGTFRLLDPELGWRVSLNKAERREPDRRQLGSKFFPIRASAAPRFKRRSVPRLAAPSATSNAFSVRSRRKASNAPAI
jgi:hypothetical protein